MKKINYNNPDKIKISEIKLAILVTGLIVSVAVNAGLIVVLSFLLS